MKKRIDWTLYTLRHKKAFLRIEKAFLGRNTWRGWLHDLDKVFLYLFCFWMSIKDVQDFHRKHQKHHVDNELPKTPTDLLETVIDWESARFTKPDKPLNAYETLMKFYPDKQDSFLPIIQKYLPHQITEKKRNDF